jgi:hypothetical protein
MKIEPEPVVVQNLPLLNDFIIQWTKNTMLAEELVIQIFTVALKEPGIIENPRLLRIKLYSTAALFIHDFISADQPSR